MSTIGFTGTLEGMTTPQMASVIKLVNQFISRGAKQARHGMALGADEEFHMVVEGAGLKVIGHPGVTQHGQVYKRSRVKPQIVMPEKFFLARNRDIVDGSTWMIATPKEIMEQARGSGTWATIRYTRKVNKPLFLVQPDGWVFDSFGNRVEL